MSLSSDELNTLIYRYLRESGFDHTAFTFGHESLIQKSNLDTTTLPAAALISYVQKGIQYAEIEYHINDDGTTSICDEPFTIFTKHTCKSKQRKKILGLDDILDSDYSSAELTDVCMFALKGHTGMVTCGVWAMRRPYLATISADNTCRVWCVDALRNASVDEIRKTSHKPYIYEAVKVVQIGDGSDGGVPPHVNGTNGVEKRSGDVAMTDSNDNGSKRAKLSNGAVGYGNTLSWCNYGAVNRSMISVDWSADATCLACGTYDGQVLLTQFEHSINSDNAAVITEVNHAVIKHHTGPVSVVRWNQSTGPALLATGSLDGTIALWPSLTSSTKSATQYTQPIHHSTLHNAPIIDIQWRSDSQFVSCAADGSLFIYTLSNASENSSLSAVKLAGHASDINQIAYDFSRSMLATCSDDATVSVWNSDTGDILHTFHGHTKEVTCVAWISSTTDDNIPSPSLLATGSLDSTIRVWDVQAQRCVGVLGRQLHPITMLAYNPTAQLLAAAAYQRLYIFSIVDGSLLRTYAPPDASTNTCINTVAWDVPTNPAQAKTASTSVATSQRLFISYSDGQTYIIDLRAAQ